MGLAALEDLGIDLAEHAGIGQRDREHAGGRPEPDHAHEHQRPDQLGYAAQRGQQQSHALAQPERQARHASAQARDRQCRGGQQRQRRRQQPAQRDAGSRHRDRAPGLARHHQQEVRIMRQRPEARKEARARAQAVGRDQQPGPEFCRDQQRPEQHQRGSAPQQSLPQGRVMPGHDVRVRASRFDRGVHSAHPFSGIASRPVRAAFQTREWRRHAVRPRVPRRAAPAWLQ